MDVWQLLRNCYLLYLHNANPAVNPLVELVDDEPLESTAYKNLITALDSFFAQTSQENADGMEAQPSPYLNLACAQPIASPNSLDGQLQFILEKWGILLGETFVHAVVRGMDFLREEVIHQHLAHGDFKPDIPLQTFGRR